MYKDMDVRLTALEERLGVEFKDRDLLLQAVTHRSYLNERPQHNLGHNERLETLGDAVIELLVTEQLFRKYPEASEGDLTNMRAALVNGLTMSEIATTLKLDDAILLSRGEQKDRDSKARRIIIGSCLEAILGAVYLDQGIGQSRLVVDHLFHSRISKIMESRREWKSDLQELIQERFRTTPHYRVLEESGPAHEKFYRVGVFVGTFCAGEGIGSSKKEAETQAAEKALTSINDWEGRCLEGAKTRSENRRSAQKGGTR